MICRTESGLCASLFKFYCLFAIDLIHVPNAGRYVCLKSLSMMLIFLCLLLNSDDENSCLSFGCYIIKMRSMKQ